MEELYVGRIDEFGTNDRRFVRKGELEIGVFRRGSDFYAYRNLCMHQGGPACEGMVIAKVEEVLAPDKTYIGETFSKDEIHFVCPWHGWEYDIRTGAHAANPKIKLQKYDVLRKGDEVYVVV